MIFISIDSLILIKPDRLSMIQIMWAYIKLYMYCNMHKCTKFCQLLFSLLSSCENAYFLKMCIASVYNCLN